MHFHLDSLWHAEEGAMEFALTNCGDTPVANPRLVYATLTRCLRPSRCTGARLIRRQANFHEYASDAGFVLQPGETWRFTEFNLTRPALHSNEGPKSAGVLLEDGTLVPAFAGDLQASVAVAGTNASQNAALTCGILPEPQQTAITEWCATAPVHLALRTDDVAVMQSVSQVVDLTRRLHPLAPTPFVLIA